MTAGTALGVILEQAVEWCKKPIKSMCLVDERRTRSMLRYVLRNGRAAPAHERHMTFAVVLYMR